MKDIDEDPADKRKNVERSKRLRHLENKLKNT
jgi:hypothetical protein